MVVCVRLFWLVLLLIFPVLAQGQEVPKANASIEGMLVDKSTGEPISGAPVQLDRGRVVISSEQGRFAFSSLTTGTHEIWIQDPEHIPVQVTFDLADSQRKELRYALDPVGKQEEEEVVVRSERLKEEVSNTQLQMEEVKKIPGTKGDIAQIVQSLPGVARGFGVSTGSGGPGLLIQGAAPEDSKVLIDGHPVPTLYHFGGLVSVINSDILKSIDFMPSSFGAEYGEAIGGVVDTRTRPWRKEKLSGYVNMSLLDVGFFLEGKLFENAGFMAAARRSTIDLWLPYVIPENAGFEFTVAPVYYDYQAKVEWIPKANHHLSLFVYGSSDELKLILEKVISGDPTLRGTMFEQIQFHRVQLSWDHTAIVDLHASLMGGYDRYHFQIGTERFIRGNYYTLSGRLDAEWPISNRMKFRFGGAARAWVYDMAHKFPRIPKEGEVPNNFEELALVEGNDGVSSLYGSLHSIADWVPYQGGLFFGGLRLEGYGDPTRSVQLMPRLGFRQELWKMAKLFLGAGLYGQPPAMDELSKTYGNPKVEAERAWHFAVRLQQDLPASVGINVEFFYKLLDNLVVPDEEKIYANRGKGEIVGMQILLRRESADNLFGWLAYTWMQSRRKDGPEEPWRLFDFDQTHILTLVAGYQLPTGPVEPVHGLRDGWEFGLRFQLVSGNPITPIVGGIYDADYETYLPIPGPINSERLPLYHRLDLRIDYTWAFSRWALTLFLDVQNVYNHRSVEGITYNYDYTKRAYYEGLPVIPFLGIKGSF
jgi:hypothetical protein